MRLRTAPRIGPVTAVAFVATLDDVTRFASAHQLEAYLGLTPREYSSGEHQHRGRTSKTGSPRIALAAGRGGLAGAPEPAGERRAAASVGRAGRRGESGDRTTGGVERSTSGLRADHRLHRAGGLAPRRDPTAPQRTFNTFRALYSDERPHETPGGRPPGALCRTSSRPFPE
jgi:hypothetical protein